MIPSYEPEDTVPSRLNFMMTTLKKPFSVNQIVKARVSFRPSVVAGNYYRIKEIHPAKSYSRWMVGVAQLGSLKGSSDAAIIETLDSEYFSAMDAVRLR